MDNLIRRTLTGIFIVLFVLGGFWLHPLSFIITGLIILFGTQYEYYSMIRHAGIRPQTIPGIITGVSLYSLSALTAAGFTGSKWFLLLFALAAFILTAELYRKQERPFDSIAHTFFSVIYTALPLSLFPFTAFSQSGLSSLIPAGSVQFSPGIVVGFFLLVWANDTGAYLTGITFGKHRLMERISPKKSWEGFIGGAVITMTVAFLLSGWLGVTGRSGWLIIAAIVSIAGTYGDLVESMLKRSLGVKDSGSIMPGHGGFLDRFDSVFISFPMVYLYITLFG